MINGFCIDVKSEEMKAIFEKRAAHHQKKVGEYEDKAREAAEWVKSHAVQVPKMPVPMRRGRFGVPLGGLEQFAEMPDPAAVASEFERHVARHKASADMCTFLAQHAIPDEVYRIRVDGGPGSLFGAAAGYMLAPEMDDEAAFWISA